MKKCNTLITSQLVTNNSGNPTQQDAEGNILACDRGGKRRLEKTTQREAS